jgi:hypothetical protein
MWFTLKKFWTTNQLRRNPCLAFFFSCFGRFFKLICTFQADLGFILTEFITILLHIIIVEIQIVEPQLQHVLPLPCLPNSHHIVFFPCRNILWVMLHQFIAYWLHFMLLITCYKRSPIFNKFCFRPWHNRSFDAYFEKCLQLFFYWSPPTSLHFMHLDHLFVPIVSIDFWLSFLTYYI